MVTRHTRKKRSVRSQRRLTHSRPRVFGNRRATRKQRQRGGEDLRAAPYGPLTIPSEFSAPGSSCSRTGGRRRSQTRKRQNVQRKQLRSRRHSRSKQNGGDLSSFFTHPWVSSSPPNTVERIATAWHGQAPFPSMDPSVSTYKALSDVDLRTGYFNNSIFTSKTL